MQHTINSIMVGEAIRGSLSENLGELIHANSGKFPITTVVGTIFIEEYQAPENGWDADSWDSGMHGSPIAYTLKVVKAGEPDRFFKIEGTYDSWDSNYWQYSTLVELRRVEKVIPAVVIPERVEVKWEEVR